MAWIIKRWSDLGFVGLGHEKRMFRASDFGIRILPPVKSANPRDDEAQPLYLGASTLCASYNIQILLSNDCTNCECHVHATKVGQAFATFSKLLYPTFPEMA